MKQKYLFTVLITIALFVVASCKKDAEKEKTTAEKIQAKWQIDNILINEHTSGEDHKTTYTVPNLIISISEQMVKSTVVFTEIPLYFGVYPFRRFKNYS